MRLDLPEGLLAVLGANGAGKSTLISAIDVALFGPDGRSLAPWYPRGGGSDPLTIELVFEHAGEIFRVRRSFSPKGRGQSKCDLERRYWYRDSEIEGWEPLTLESQTATQEYIEATIGLSRATFRASSYLAQGDAGAFCDALPGQRKAILAEVVGLADWDRWLQRAKTERRACELEIAESRALLERADEELAQREKITDDREVAAELEKAQRAALEDARAKLAAARERLAEAQARVERRTACENAHTAAETVVAGLRARIANGESEIASIDARLAQRERLSEQAERIPDLEWQQQELTEALSAWQERQRLLAESAQAEARGGQHAEAAEELARRATAVLDAAGEEHCDRCGQVLGGDAAERAAASYRAEAQRHLDEVNALAARVGEIQALVATMPTEAPDGTRLKGLVDELAQAREAHRRLAALDEASARRESAFGELERMRAELPGRESVAAVALADLEALGPHDPDAAEAAKLELVRLEGAEERARTLVEQSVREVARCIERLQRLADIEQEAEVKRERVSVLVAALEVRAAMERACSPNGIPALILENVAIPQVEAEASRLLRVLGGPATAVELRTLRETKTAGIAETLDIVLLTETGEANYETFSGGEKARIAFALRLALAQLLAGRKGADTGLLIVDEVEGLDRSGVAALVGVLEELQRNVPRIVVVSHDAELRDSFPQTLLLENIDGRSRIVHAPTSDRSGEVIA